MFTLNELKEKIKTPEGIEEVVFSEEFNLVRDNFTKVLDRLSTRDRSVVLYTADAVADFVSKCPEIFGEVPVEFEEMVRDFFYPTLFMFRYFKEHNQRLGRISEDSLLAVPGLLEAAQSIEVGKEIEGLKNNKDFDDTVLSLVDSFLNMSPIFSSSVLSVIELIYQVYTAKNSWHVFFESLMDKGYTLETEMMIPILVAGFSEVKKSLFPGADVSNPEEGEKIIEGLKLDGRESMNLFASKASYFILHPELEPECDPNIDWEARKERFAESTSHCVPEFYEELIFLGDLLTKFTLKRPGDILTFIYQKGEVKYTIDYYTTLLLLRKAGLKFECNDVIVCPSVQNDPDLEYLSENLNLKAKADFLPNSPQFDRLTRRIMESMIMVPKAFFEDLSFPIIYVSGSLSGKLVEDFCYPLVGSGIEMKDAKKGMILLSAFMRAVVSLNGGDYWNGEDTKTGVITRTLN